jgi:intraflagellar transport protein 56
MRMSRVKGVGGASKFGASKKVENAKKTPQLQEYIKNRDYTGAIALMEFQRASTTEEEMEVLPWLGYAAFHLGDYRKALEAYQAWQSTGEAPEEVHLYIGCCYFYLQQYAEAEESAKRGPKAGLQNRLLFHIAHRTNDESKLMVFHQNLNDTKEDQLSLAAIHYLRSHFQEATDIYKRLLLENRDDLALNVYVAMCYYKLDYYDVSLEILAVYLQAHPDSAIAINLKACNHFRLYNGKAAEAELKSLTDQGHNIADNDLIRHNKVVFRNGENALKVLPPLVDFVPEARLNLVIYYLRNDEIGDAYDLVKDVEPTTPQEYILKGVVNACVGQNKGSREHLKMAQQFFQLVGASASECDTIPGRQCMASCFFLLKQFEDVNIYLNSIKAYLYNDDDFNWNYGISLASTGNFKEAEETLLLVQSDKYRSEYCYLSWLSRCYIMNKKARLAWELYLKMDNTNESFNLLQLIANDSYKMGAFFYAAKAFDVLERLDPDPEYWEGKRGACVGVFQQVVAGMEPKESLREVLAMLRNTSNPQVEYFIRIIKKWCKENGLKW